MDDQPQLSPVPARPARPKTLTVLCVLTFIGSGMNAISSLAAAAFFDIFRAVAGELQERFDLPGIEPLLNTSPLFFLTYGGLFICSLSGAVMMWRLRKAGFHVYTIAQILLLIAPMYFLRMPGPSIPDLFLSGLFIILYSTQLKQLQ